MDGLLSIGEVVARFEVPISTLHYWERRGLITPHRRSGRRHFDTDQLYRLALIKLWQGTGLMSLDEIATVLAGHDGEHDWRDTVTGRMAAIEEQVARLNAGHEYLRHLLECPVQNGLDECPEFRAQVAALADVSAA
ncbi:MerR family transcriptional regulator [Saccharopolyspora indica]|uniref:MerR family transcriptional regulator n=1 Tax=Saccharopolyspora indica TaxID=1229659 RepID=UPI0022EB16F9|nr:MerR family transcriptional regulator [Saccharopolyspora indica]MDA3646852.1 MerR family transcriptional regulator [Saccharopolyspora indica]